MKLQIKKLTCVLMVFSILTFTGCGSKKDDDVATSTQVEAPSTAPEPEPEPILTYEDYFPQANLLGKSIDTVSQTYEVFEDVFEDVVVRYRVEGINLCDLVYGDTLLYVDESDIVEKVEFNFFFGNVYGDVVELQLQDSSTNIDKVHELLNTINAVELSNEENNLLNIIDDFNSGKIYEGDNYTSKFTVDGMEVTVSCLVNPVDLNAYYNDKGMIIKKSISFKLSDDITDTTESESAE